MKNKISFLAIIAAVFCANCANASECVGKDCEFAPIEIQQDINIDEIVEPVVYDINLEQMPAYDSYEYTETCEYETCVYDYNCPFDTEIECAIWYKKPIHMTTLTPRAPHMNAVREDDILYAIFSNYSIDANDPAMSSLLERYKILMRASRACCSEGIMYKMRENGADEKDIYEFLKNDANYFAVASRCMVMNDEDIEHSYSNGVTGKMVVDVRNACLCKNRQWFETLLQPFWDIYQRAPMFENEPFVYTYSDDMQRDITVYINDEVHTTMGLLNACPK